MRVIKEKKEQCKMMKNRDLHCKNKILSHRKNNARETTTKSHVRCNHTEKAKQEQEQEQQQQRLTSNVSALERQEQQQGQLQQSSCQMQPH
jgi:hypothetical protein